MDSTLPAFPETGEVLPVTLPVAVVDARPVLRRTEDNPWDQTEQVRTRLVHLIEATSRKLGFQALVLESGPYVHPAWIKVESWKQMRDGALTMRAEMTVTITAVPFHRYPHVYRVSWAKLGQGGSVDNLYAFTESHVARMLGFLWAEPTGLTVGGDEVKSMFDDAQLRTEWWHTWKPRNRCIALRRDWMLTSAGGLICVGLLLVLVGFAYAISGSSDAADPGGDSTAAFPPADTTMAAAPAWDTVVTTATSDTAAAVSFPDTTMAPPAQMSSVVYAGTGVFGWLEPSDRRLSDTNAPYDEWTYHARGGDRMVVTVRSTAFPPIMEVGQLRNGAWVSLAMGDASISTSSRIEITVPADGDYTILVASLDPTRAGEYSLNVN